MSFWGSIVAHKQAFSALLLRHRRYQGGRLRNVRAVDHIVKGYSRCRLSRLTIGKNGIR
jgi:hypothetical protein